MSANAAAAAQAHDFLRLCLTAHWRAEALAHAETLAMVPGFDWQACLAEAQRERVAGLLYAALKSQPWAPLWLIEVLRRAYMATGSRNALLLDELARVVARLGAADIPVLVLKGVALLAQVYDNVGLRPMVDLDLLVRREDMPAALDCLAAVGYAATHAEPVTGLALAFENEVLLSRFDRIELAVELHWSLFDSPYYQQRLAMEWFWQTAADARVGALSIRVLGPEATLLHLCGHLALHHQGQGLLWQRDIAALIVRDGAALDWDRLQAQAQAFHLVLPLQRLLPRLAQEWGVPVPDAVLARLASLQPSAEEAWIFAQLTAAQRTVLQRLRADLAAIPGWRGRLRYAWANLFPSPTYMRRRYALRHGIFVPLAYPYRWALGLVEGWKQRLR